VKIRAGQKFLFEFTSIFFAVISAFALNNWNDNRKENLAQEKILVEILNGLKKDTHDLNVNRTGHKAGIRACQYWRSILSGEEKPDDSLNIKYIQLVRDFNTVQNNSGYETLKSKGFEIIDNDSLRASLISLYEYDYYIIKSLEEDYEEMQFQRQYFHRINDRLAPFFQFDQKGDISGMHASIQLTQKDKRLLLSYFLKIELNLKMMLHFYQKTQENVEKMQAAIKSELNLNRCAFMFCPIK